MNQTQVKYARARLQNIKANKIREARDTFNTPAKILSLDEKIKLIRSGKAEKRPDAYRSRSLDSAFDWGELQQSEITTEKTKEVVAKLEEEFTKVEDQLVLGDCEEALQQLIALENMEIK